MNQFLSIEQQIEYFEKGSFRPKLVSSCSVKKGVHKFEPSEIQDYVELFVRGSKNKKIVRFVPASGAASRMFKSLEVLASEYAKNNDEESINILVDSNADIAQAIDFLVDLPKYPIFDDLIGKLIRSDIDYYQLIKEKKYGILADAILYKIENPPVKMPKGLIPFHFYKGVQVTPVFEHIREAIYSADDFKDEIEVHFTISEEHQELFEEEFKLVKDFFSDYKIIISFSFQDARTNTIAVDSQNRTINIAENELLYRQGGHGALIHNLNEIDADLVLIKNIDNIAPDEYSEINAVYNQLLIGYFLKVQEQLHNYAKKFDDEHKTEIKDFIKTHFAYYKDDALKDIEYLRELIKQPLRVCGVVVNKGEPGGGPFFATLSNGRIAKQIIEAAQVDFEDAEQKEIFYSSTHFNPVNMVCELKNWSGHKHNLINFIDDMQFFISEKSYNGKPIKALELPGLWNGAMAKWNTVFVELPPVTFNPTKKITDLNRGLRAELLDRK